MNKNLNSSDPVYIVYWYNQDCIYQGPPKIVGIYNSKDEAFKRQQEICGKG